MSTARSANRISLRVCTRRSARRFLMSCCPSAARFLVTAYPCRPLSTCQPAIHSRAVLRFDNPPRNPTAPLAASRSGFMENIILIRRSQGGGGGKFKRNATRRFRSVEGGAERAPGAEVCEEFEVRDRANGWRRSRRRRLARRRRLTISRCAESGARKCRLLRR